jgi:phenol hydroxylase P3 protein
VIKFILEQDPDNLPIVQQWIDKWTWRGYRVLTLVGMMMDYMLPKRIMSWKEAWEVYFEENGGALFKDLARYGIRRPWLDQIEKDKDHISHQAWAVFYNYAAACNFHTWIPTDDEMDWLSRSIPTASTSTTGRAWSSGVRRPRRATASTTRRCPCCARPARSPCCSPSRATRPRSATGVDYKDNKYHFCSDGCKEIFEHEPEKYIQAWLPVHQIYQGNCFNEGVDPTAEGFDPLAAVLDYYHLNFGRDNLDFEGSEDQKNFDAWRGMATKNT